MIYNNNEDKIKNINFKDNYFVVIDFDKTLTAGSSETSWGLTAKSKGIGRDYEEKRHNLFLKYRPIELDVSLSDEIKTEYMAKWVEEHIDLFFEYHLKESALIEATHKDYIFFREGAEKFLNEMYKQNVPVIIISAGVGNVICEFLKVKNCLYDNIHIISNFIEFENDEIKEIKGEIIHSMNKSINSTAKEFIDSKEYGILFRRFNWR